MTSVLPATPRPRDETEQNAPEPKAEFTLMIRSDQIHQAFHALFPPERMLVFGGSRSRDEIRLGGMYDVTGTATAGNVKADPERLARALMSMEHTGTFLAAWIHSHPGTGPLATAPSATDLRQHNDWLEHYSPQLVSAILVADGTIRFWGDAVRSGLVSIEIEGSGVTLEENNVHTITR